MAVLTERHRDVLKSLIQLHIATGEPVGSEILSRHFNRSVSSATLRNLMADLERMGYLEHPHTSAGRMPTDEGYRVYVDSLTGHPLRPREAAAIDSQLTPPEASAEQVLQNASELLSRLTRNVGFAMAPRLERATFRHVDLVRLPYPRILVVVVTSTGLVTSRVIEVTERFGQDDLQACANYLNTHFAGLTLEAARARLLDLMREEKALYDSLVQRAVAVGQRAFALEGDNDGVYLGSAASILEQPEFEDLDRMRALFRTFEEKSRLVRILNACLGGNGLRVVIGREIPDPELRDLALVTASYPLEGETGWGVGVVGATRMPYDRVMGLVEHIGQAVSRALRELKA